MVRSRDIGPFIIALLIPQIAGGIGAFATTPSITTWYAGLQKPYFVPPNWIFGPVWTTLFLLMGIASFIVWRNGKGAARVAALQAYGVQLVLNVCWSVLFFGLQRPDLALVEIVILWLAILWTMIRFFRISRPAGLLLIPYACWVGFASILNAALWSLNG